ncbi:MAG: hypothetical protein R6W95_11590 [Desulfosarcina sp.]
MADKLEVIYDALEGIIHQEVDADYLALIAALLNELSERALERSGRQIIHDGSRAIN